MNLYLVQRKDRGTGRCCYEEIQAAVVAASTDAEALEWLPVERDEDWYSLEEWEAILVGIAIESIQAGAVLVDFLEP